MNVKAFMLVILVCSTLSSSASSATSNRPLRALDQPADVTKVKSDSSVQRSLDNIRMLLDQLPNEPNSQKDDDPLRAVAHDMAEVAGALGRYATGQPVQKKQAGIVGQLDVLIARLEKSCSSCRSCGAGGASSRPSNPMQDSKLAGGPGGVGDLLAPKGKGEHQLVSLKPKQREQILQSMNEGFPSGYESVLREYYKRLAQGEINPEPADTGAELP